MLTKGIGDLLITEDNLARGEPHKTGERDRRDALSKAREKHLAELQNLREGVKTSVQAEASWRKSGVRPGHFSRGIAWAPTASEATQTDAAPEPPAVSKRSTAVMTSRDPSRGSSPRGSSPTSVPEPRNTQPRRPSFQAQAESRQRRREALRARSALAVAAAPAEGGAGSGAGSEGTKNEEPEEEAYDSDETPEERAEREARRSVEIAEKAGEAQLAKMLRQAEAIRRERKSGGSGPTGKVHRPFRRSASPQKRQRQAMGEDDDLEEGGEGLPPWRANRPAPRPPQPWEVSANVPAYRSMLARARMLREKLQAHGELSADLMGPERGGGEHHAVVALAAAADDTFADSAAACESGAGWDEFRGAVDAASVDGLRQQMASGGAQAATGGGVQPANAGGAQQAALAEQQRQAAKWAARAASHSTARFWCDQQAALASASRPPNHPAHLSSKPQADAPAAPPEGHHGFARYPYVHSCYTQPAPPAAAPDASAGSIFAMPLPAAMAAASTSFCSSAAGSAAGSRPPSRPGSALGEPHDYHDLGVAARQHAAACAAAATAAHAAAKAIEERGLSRSSSSSACGGSTNSSVRGHKTPSTGWRSTHRESSQQAPPPPPQQPQQPQPPPPQQPRTPWAANASALSSGSEASYDDPTTIAMPACGASYYPAPSSSVASSQRAASVAGSAQRAAPPPQASSPAADPYYWQAVARGAAFVGQPFAPPTLADIEAKLRQQEYDAVSSASSFSVPPSRPSTRPPSVHGGRGEGGATSGAGRAEHLEGLLDEWLYRARMRAYSSALPPDDVEGGGYDAPRAASALARGLESVLAM